MRRELIPLDILPPRLKTGDPHGREVLACGWPPLGGLTPASQASTQFGFRRVRFSSAEARV
jgi:hypothetical protein